MRKEYCSPSIQILEVLSQDTDVIMVSVSENGETGIDITGDFFGD